VLVGVKVKVGFIILEQYVAVNASDRKHHGYEGKLGDSIYAFKNNC
tara:strand:- start:739 stop:876 length:138 start_codon:yes stop_codon:yes gene_type:complete